MRYQKRSGNNWTRKTGKLRRRYGTISKIKSRLRRR